MCLWLFVERRLCTKSRRVPIGKAQPPALFFAFGYVFFCFFPALTLPVVLSGVSAIQSLVLAYFG